MGQERPPGNERAFFLPVADAGRPGMSEGSGNDGHAARCCVAGLPGKFRRQLLSDMPMVIASTRMAMAVIQLPAIRTAIRIQPAFRRSR